MTKNYDLFPATVAGGYIIGSGGVSRVSRTIPLELSTPVVPGLFMNATINAPLRSTISELPIRVRDAAVFLGVSPQTVYLWVERKQIPHLRVMGRNIRFLKSELEPFRAQFKQEIGNGKTE